jgi:Nuclear cap-binding protein subunit 3
LCIAAAADLVTVPCAVATSKRHPSGMERDSSPAVAPATRALEDAISERRRQHSARAARFGTATVARVTDVSVLGARRAAARPGGGFVTGFDITAPDEDTRRATRAARFACLAPETTAGGARDGAAAAVAATVSSSAVENLSFAGSVDGPSGTAQKRSVVQLVDPLENRRDVAIGEVLRPNTIHVFGVDKMSTENIRQHFLEYGPSWIEWINDSSCNITFEDGFTAARVLRFMPPLVDDSTTVGDGSASNGAAADHDGLMGALAEVPSAPPDRMCDDENAGFSVPVAAEGGGELPDAARWRPAAPFVTRSKTLMPLWMRAATERDVRPPRPNPRSKWARTVVGGKEQKQRMQQLQQRTKRRGRVPNSAEKNNDDVKTEEGDQSASDDKDQNENTRQRRAGAATSRNRRNRRLGVRGGIAKAMARRFTVMDVDRALESL